MSAVSHSVVSVASRLAPDSVRKRTTPKWPLQAAFISSASPDSSAAVNQSADEREDHSETEIFEELCRQQTYTALPVTDRLVIFFRAAFDETILSSNQVGKYVPVLEKIVNGSHPQYQLIALTEHFCTVEYPDLLALYPILLKLMYDEDILEEENLMQWATNDVRKEYAHWAVNDELAQKLKTLLQLFIEWLENAEEENDDDDDE